MNDPFYMQRVMRANRAEALQRGIAAIVDIGSQNISCIVVRINSAAVGPIGGGASQPVGQPRYQVICNVTSRSAGVEFGEIRNLGQALDALRLVIAKAQKMAQVRVDHVFACFSGGNPVTATIRGTVELGGNSVTEDDIVRALNSCKLPILGPNREYLHAHPINFSVDRRSGLLDPRGEAGSRLSVDLHLVAVDKYAMGTFIKCIEECKLSIAGLATSSYVSALSTLIEEEQEAGAACVDIGAGTTGISVFYKKHIVYARTLRVGGAHVTADICNAFSIDAITAERLKTVDGSVVATQRDDRTFCSLAAERSNGTARRITRTELIGVMRPRVEEILEDVGQVLDAADFAAVPGRRIVVTGGCSHMLDLEELTQFKLGSNVRFGRPLRVAGLLRDMAGPQYSAVVGLCLHAISPQDESWDFPFLSGSSSKSMMERTLNWVVDNW